MITKNLKFTILQARISNLKLDQKSVEKFSKICILSQKQQIAVIVYKLFRRETKASPSY